jgi:hypothetical protein
MSLAPAPFRESNYCQKKGDHRISKLRSQHQFCASHHRNRRSSAANPISTTLIITLVALGAFFFTLSFVSFEKGRALSRNDASVSSAAGELVSEILKAIGTQRVEPLLLLTAPRETVKNQAVSNDNASTTPGFNGIGIFPSSKSTSRRRSKAERS